MCCLFCVFFFKQKTAYEMRMSGWSADVCSSDLAETKKGRGVASPALFPSQRRRSPPRRLALVLLVEPRLQRREIVRHRLARHFAGAGERLKRVGPGLRSEEHTSELQSLMRISYAVFCLKKKNKSITTRHQ